MFRRQLCARGHRLEPFGLERHPAPDSTVASSGTGGRISNNATLAYPSPTASWGTVSHEGLFDAASAGNLIFWAALSASCTVPVRAARRRPTRGQPLYHPGLNDHR